MSKQRDDIKPIPYQLMWQFAASDVTQREITLQALMDDVEHPLNPAHRKELEGRIKIAKLICSWIDWGANHVDVVDDTRRRDRRLMVKAHEEASA